MKLEYQDMKLNFTGLSFAHNLAVSAAGTFFSSVIQPIIFDLVSGLQDSL